MDSMEFQLGLHYIDGFFSRGIIAGDATILILSDQSFNHNNRSIAVSSSISVKSYPYIMRWMIIRKCISSIEEQFN